VRRFEGCEGCEGEAGLDLFRCGLFFGHGCRADRAFTGLLFSRVALMESMFDLAAVYLHTHEIFLEKNEAFKKAADEASQLSNSLSFVRGKLKQFVNSEDPSVMIRMGRQTLVVRNKPGFDTPDVEIYREDGSLVT
jgi:hypothetical protein